MSLSRNAPFGRLIHDHNRAAWLSGAITTSFVCPADVKTLLLHLLVTHANATGVWDVHFFVGTTSGGSELLGVGGNAGTVGAGLGTGTYYPYSGTYVVPITPDILGKTLYVTSFAAGTSYYLAGEIKVFGH